MVVTRKASLILGLSIAIAAAVPAFAAGTIAFSEQTWNAGIDHITSMPQDMTQRQMYGGGAVADFNRDGWPDIYLLGGGGADDSLYINDGDGTFTESAESWGLLLRHYGRGVTAGDFNNDGWPDLYVTTNGPDSGGDTYRNMLYRNNGDGTFTDIAVSAGVNQLSATSKTPAGAAFGDFDLDGDLDLAVADWEGIDGNRLFRNDGDETFTDVTIASETAHTRYGFSPRFVDMNGDRYPELLISADYGSSLYFINDGDGTFTEATAASGTGFDDNGMGGTVADFNRDGLPDWYVTSIYADTTDQDGNFLYVNQGDHAYTVNPEVNGARNGGWGWGVDAVDLDHDGWTDIVETNGWVSPEWEFENSYMWRNNGDLTFSEVQGYLMGFDYWGQGRGLMLIDYDRDGDMDFVINAWDEAALLYRNDLSGTDIHWLEVLLDTSGHAGLAPQGYGAKITITAGGATQYFWMNGGTTYSSRSQLVAHFGLGAATTVDTLRVDWPDGTNTVQSNVPADQILTVTPSGGSGGDAPGEASSLPGSQMTAAYDGGTGRIDVAFTPACDASDHTVYYGPLADVGTYGFAGAECAVGMTGSASFDPGAGDYFFVVVGTQAAAEGSYGLDGSGAERAEDELTPGCDVPQDLSGTCTP